MTVRQVFYQLVTRGVIEKTEEQYQGTVIRLMTEMRLDGSLSRFDWVVDESRRVRITETYDSIPARAQTDRRVLSPQCARASSADYVEVWVEKDALAGVMWDATSDYDVPLMVSRGMPKHHLPARQRLWQSRPLRGSADKQSYIYQFGDHDPSGVPIPQDHRAAALKRLCTRLDCPPANRQTRGAHQRSKIKS